MPRTTLTVVSPVTGNGYPTIPLTALAADLTFVAANAVDGNDFVHTGREIIIVRNTDDTNPLVFTVSAAANRFLRTGTSIVYTLQPLAISLFGPFPLEGWRQVDGKQWLAAADAALEIAIVRMPTLP